MRAFAAYCENGLAIAPIAVPATASPNTAKPTKAKDLEEPFRSPSTDTLRKRKRLE